MKTNTQKNNSIPKKLQAGFTLIELVLYLGLAAVFLLVISIFLALLLGARIKNQTVAEVNEQGSAVMRLITQNIRNAEGINSPAAGASASALSLDALGSGSDPMIFDLSGTTLRITEGAAAPVSLTSSRLTASGLTVQNLSRPGTSGNIRIQFTLTHVNPGGKNEFDYSKTFYGTASLR